MAVIAAAKGSGLAEGNVPLRRRIFRRMVKMIRRDSNIVRPRKSTAWTPDSIKPKKVPIFKIGENDFSVGGRGNSSFSFYPHEFGPTKIHSQPSEAPITATKGSLLHQLEKYCENTTLHGLRYVGDPHLTFGERIFWFISFSLAVGFATYYICEIYAKWKRSPVIISFSPFDAEIGSIPFPAITICNMNQAKKSEALKILKYGTNVEKKLLDDSCSGNASFQDTENIKWEPLRDFLIRVGNSCSDMLKYCQWGNDKINCDEAFNNDLTDEGLCCSFNRLPPDKIFRNMKDISILNQTYPSNVYDWNAENGFPETDSGDAIPRRPLGAGAHLGLTLILDAQIDNYYCSSTHSTGFKVILSNPIETPKMADFGFMVSPGYETRIVIEPSVREATSALRNIPIEKRQCYFSNERPLQYYSDEKVGHKSFQICGQVFQLVESVKPSKLYAKKAKATTVSQFLNGLSQLLSANSQFMNMFVDYFNKTHIRSNQTIPKNKWLHQDLATMLHYFFHFLRSYTQENCLQECQSNVSLLQCHCTPYYLPKNTYTIYCGKQDDNCTHSVKRDVFDTKGGSYLNDACQCKPGCFEIIYHYSVSTSSLLPHSLVKYNISSKQDIKSLLVANFYFPTVVSQRQIKDVLYGFTEVLSNFGGILSLCLGISFLSIIELVYFASLRLLCQYGNEKRAKKKDCGKINLRSRLDANDTTLDPGLEAKIAHIFYTQRNCMLECQSNYTLDHCNCVPYYLPKNKHIKNCGKSEKECVERAKENMETVYGNGKNMAVIHFFFYKSQFTKEIKSELYGITEILSNIGGLLSLCLGFSFLSFIELIYFVTLRVICDVAQHARKAKKKLKDASALPFMR